MNAAHASAQISLYNDEFAKLNKKHEKDYSELKVEIAQEKKKFSKLEIHAGKLQQQICNLNEKNLELMKENEFIKSKLRIMEEIREERKSMLPPPAHARLCANLKMEDEEGEIFNNTYLTDLKSGRMTPPFTGRESIRYSELQQRNSMVPPHLRSSYLPQYADEVLTDDDNRDIVAGTLDDSSTSLISRKKLSGTTSYKRPGPPTPSKKAGRLSFGGSLPTNDFQYKDILKDNSNGHSSSATTGTTSFGSRLSFGGRKSNVDSSMAPGAATAAAGGSGSIADLNARRKTPGKFKQMISSSNLFNTLQHHKDETPKRHDLPPVRHPLITKINCEDDTDSGSSRLDDRQRGPRSRRNSTNNDKTKKDRKNLHFPKIMTRFDMNRRLSSSNNSSDSAGSSPTSNADTGGDDPYGGFSYEGTPDRIHKIDINSMPIFDKSVTKPKVMVFSGDRKDVNNNEDHGTASKTPKKIDPYRANKRHETSIIVQRLCTNRRDKHRRKSRDQRRQFFNRLRNIDVEAIGRRSPIEDRSFEDAQQSEGEELSIDRSKSRFETLLDEVALVRPSEILPNSRIRLQLSMYDPFEDVVSSSTGLRSVGSPLLERISEIIRTALRQREYSETWALKAAEGETPTSGDGESDWARKALRVCVGVFFLALGMWAFRWLKVRDM